MYRGMATTKIWYRDLRAAFDKDNAHKFVPLRTMNLTQQLNATFRLAVYYSVVMTLLTRNPGHLTVALIATVITAVINEMASSSYGKESFAGSTRCVSPKKGNPYMNVTLADLELDPTRPAACDQSAPAVASLVDKLDSAPLTDGPYDRDHSRWYTMPVTTVPNDQGAFAQALYGGKQSNALGARA